MSGFQSFIRKSPCDTQCVCVGRRSRWSNQNFFSLLYTSVIFTHKQHFWGLWTSRSNCFSTWFSLPFCATNCWCTLCDATTHPGFTFWWTEITIRIHYKVLHAILTYATQKSRTINPVKIMQLTHNAAFKSCRTESERSLLPMTDGSSMVHSQQY